MAPFLTRLGNGGGTAAGFGFGRIGYKAPTYIISPSTSSVNEGSTVTFNVVTTNVSDGTTLYWTTNTVSGTVNSSDFNDSATSGSFTITNGSGTITRTLANDATTEGSESFQLQVRTGSISGTIVATSSTVTINDTSLTPTYSVSPSTTSVNEGSSVTFTTTTTNVSDGTTLYWTISTVSGTVNSSDFSGGATSGSFTVTSNSGSVVLTLASDLTTEGSESFQFQVRTGSTSGTIVATSSTVTINDTSTANSYRYIRWVVTDLKNFSAANSVQASEFVLRNNSVDLSMSGVTVTNPGGSNPGGESPPNLVDNNTGSKWLDFNIKASPFTSTVIFDMGTATSFNGYKWATANDAEERDPKSWTVSGSNDNVTYTLLHTVTGFVATSARNTYQTAQSF